MASLRRHRRGIAEVEDYDDSGTAGEDTDTATDEEEEDDDAWLTHSVGGSRAM